jgi:hypothetical protein
MDESDAFTSCCCCCCCSCRYYWWYWRKVLFLSLCFPLFLHSIFVHDIIDLTTVERSWWFYDIWFFYCFLKLTSKTSMSRRCYSVTGNDECRLVTLLLRDDNATFWPSRFFFYHLYPVVEQTLLCSKSASVSNNSLGYWHRRVRAMLALLIEHA